MVFPETFVVDLLVGGVFLCLRQPHHLCRFQRLQYRFPIILTCAAMRLQFCWCALTPPPSVLLSPCLSTNNNIKCTSFDAYHTANQSLFCAVRLSNWSFICIV
ncbi:hypothetical protein AAZV13_12G050700 [Glycine max]